MDVVIMPWTVIPVKHFKRIISQIQLKHPSHLNYFCKSDHILKETIKTPSQLKITEKTWSNSTLQNKFCLVFVSLEEFLEEFLLIQKTFQWDF